MNHGVLPGLTPGVWTRFRPLMKCVGGADPFLDDTGSTQYITGQYLFRPTGLILAMIQVQFIGNFTIGSGGNYAFKLPYPAHRALGPNNPSPIPIGDGMCYLSFSNPSNPNVNMQVTPTLSDPNVALDDPDYWCQAYAPHILDWGTGTWASGTNSLTITHRAGFAFNPEDFTIVFANTANNVWWPPHVVSISSTHIALATPTGTNLGNNATYYYKIRAEPPTGQSGALLSPTVPWDWSRATSLTPFGNFFFKLRYRPRR